MRHARFIGRESKCHSANHVAGVLPDLSWDEKCQTDKLRRGAAFLARSDG